jgi:hypothetical protein
LYGKDCENHKLRSGGRLADVAPTLLQLMNLPQPAEMSGRSLLQSGDSGVCESHARDDGSTRALKKALTTAQHYIYGLQRAQTSTPLTRAEVLAATIQTLRDNGEYSPLGEKLDDLENELRTRSEH